jgi:ketol-acid reductoisomerase
MGAVEVTFRQEAELDLFIQQAFLPSLHNLLMHAAELLIAEGYPPEMALLDLYVSGELGYTLNKAASEGFMDTLRMYSPMAQYGMLSRAERFADARLRRQMELVLDEVRSGQFAREWAAEAANGYPRLDALRARRCKLHMWALERQVIAQIRTPLADPESENPGLTGDAPPQTPPQTPTAPGQGPGTL